jgi:hypothetical protein
LVELLKPARGGFLRPFGCGWFIREFLLGHAPNGSPVVNPDVGAPQADIFYYYKMADCYLNIFLVLDKNNERLSPLASTARGLKLSN